MTASPRAAVEHLCVDHGRFEVIVAEQFLDGADVIAVFEQVDRETVTQGLATALFGDPGRVFGLLDGSLDRIFQEMMAPEDAGAGINGALRRGEDILPTQFAAGKGVFVFKGGR